MKLHLILGDTKKLVGIALLEFKFIFFKSLIPLAGGLLILQGVSESMRCILCIKNGKWMKRHDDVRETEEDLISRKKEEERQRKALGK